MTKCYNCGAEQRTDWVDTLGWISSLIFFFSLGGSIVYSWGLSNLHFEWIMPEGWSWGFAYVEIFPKIFILVAFGFGFLSLFCIAIKWFER